MENERDEGRILDQIERNLVHDDPGLAFRMGVLNQQFLTAREEHDQQDEVPAQRDGRKVAVVCLILVALVGLLVTAALAASSDEGAPASPMSSGLLTGVVHVERL